ncbi:MAG: hypothetical protein IKD77_05545 [Bacilli bacterium]|nr:hypothetical protein [Bacilli bacterium]
MTFKEKLEREREEITDKINNPIKYSRIHFFKRLADKSSAQVTLKH